MPSLAGQRAGLDQLDVDAEPRALAQRGVHALGGRAPPDWPGARPRPAVRATVTEGGRDGLVPALSAEYAARRTRA